MSNYQSKALNPRNGTVEVVSMLDDWFGKHQFAVAFQDGSKYPENQVVCIHPNDLDAEDVRVFYQGESAVIWTYHGKYLVEGIKHRRFSDACMAFKIAVDQYKKN